MFQRLSKFHVTGIALIATILAFLVYNRSAVAPEQGSGSGLGRNPLDRSRKHFNGATGSDNDQSPARSTNPIHRELSQMNFSEAIAAIEDGKIPLDRLSRLILRFADDGLRLSLLEYLYSSKNYNPSDKIQVVNELADSISSITVQTLFENFHKDPTIGWEKTIELAESLSNPQIKDSAHEVAYAIRYNDSKNYEELISEETVKALGAIRESDMGRAQFLGDVLDSIFARSGSDMAQFERIMQAVENYKGSEKFKLILAFEIRRSNLAEFEEWSKSSGKYQDVNFENLKEEVRKLGGD